MVSNDPSPHPPSLRLGLPAPHPSRRYHAQSLLGPSFHDQRTHHVLNVNDTYTQTYIYTCTFKYRCTYTHIHAHTYTYACIYTRMHRSKILVTTPQRVKQYHRRTYASICIYMHIHNYIHIHICAQPAASVSQMCTLV